MTDTTVSQCESCRGLNTSCPEGCGRDGKTGELNGSRCQCSYCVSHTCTKGASPPEQAVQNDAVREAAIELGLSAQAYLDGGSDPFDETCGILEAALVALEKALAATPPEQAAQNGAVRPRFHVEGQTSTEGRRWQIWDGVKHRAVLFNLFPEGTADAICAEMNAIATPPAPSLLLKKVNKFE